MECEFQDIYLRCADDVSYDDLMIVPLQPKTMQTSGSSQFQSVSSSDAADLKNNLTQTRSFEFSDSSLSARQG